MASDLVKVRGIIQEALDEIMQSNTGTSLYNQAGFFQGETGSWAEEILDRLTGHDYQVVKKQQDIHSVGDPVVKVTRGQDASGVT